MYSKDRAHKNHINWRCIERACSGRLQTTDPPEDGAVPLEERGEHSHVPDPAQVEYKKLQARAKQRASDTNEAPRRVVSDALVGVSEDSPGLSSWMCSQCRNQCLTNCHTFCCSSFNCNKVLFEPLHYKHIALIFITLEYYALILA